MSQLIYLNGKLVPREQATVSVFDHGLLYGDGVFEGIRSYGGKVFKLPEHIRRLYDSARSIALTIPMTEDAMAQAVIDTFQANHLADGYVRLVVTRGEGNLGLDPRSCKQPNIIIIAGTLALYPAEYYEKGLELVTASTMRNNPAALNPRIKSLNYLNNIMARIEGTLAGCVEALMLNHKGEVAECTGDNIFIVRDRVLKTPPPDAGILEGITRNAVIELAHAAQYRVEQVALSRFDIFSADECFLTGTAAELIPVTKLDGRPIGSGTVGPVFTDLLSRFKAAVLA